MTGRERIFDESDATERDQPHRGLGAAAQAPEVNDDRYEALLSAAEGETLRQTAERLGCSEAWVARLRHQVCVQLGAKNMTHAVALAFQKKILH